MIDSLRNGCPRWTDFGSADWDSARAKRTFSSAILVELAVGGQVHQYRGGVRPAAAGNREIDVPESGLTARSLI